MDPRKCSNIIDWLKNRKESVIFLQEIYFSAPEDLNFLKSIWKGSIFSTFGGRHRRAEVLEDDHPNQRVLVCKTSQSHLRQLGLMGQC